MTKKAKSTLHYTSHQPLSLKVRERFVQACVFCGLVCVVCGGVCFVCGGLVSDSHFVLFVRLLCSYACSLIYAIIYLFVRLCIVLSFRVCD